MGGIEVTDLALDGEDLLVLPVFMLGSLGQLGFLSVSLAGISLSTVLYSFSADGYTSQISIGLMLSVLAIGYVLWTNDLGWRGWSAMQIWLVIVVVWLVVSPPFVPLMKTLLMGSTWGGFVAFVLQTVGFSTLSYLG
ncbi:hypothetical protein HSR122_1488 [Halapricum desulfuricans]|uniref:Uncharacterized protein n=1 Tax=Halapricum desulfuricans TaxID=2841257 RepID=A0A897N8W7_9EURY|nr:hypothetical protein HSR122_1488 [Halapricum desulfuricans]